MASKEKADPSRHGGFRITHAGGGERNGRRKPRPYKAIQDGEGGWHSMLCHYEAAEPSGTPRYQMGKG